MITRRGFLRGLSVAVAAPAIVRVASLMPVKMFASDGIITPASIADELALVMRRAFVPRVFVQIYAASPTMNLLLENEKLSAQAA